MPKVLRIALLVSAVLGLVAVRLFQSELFYDPFIEFFKQEYYTLAFPELLSGKMLLNTAFRFLINAGLSLTILYLIFKEKRIVVLSSIIYGLTFIVLFAFFWYLIQAESTAYSAIFYVRRFLIQPLLLLLLLPAFYYNKKVQ